jgi:alpha-1,2-mannosyltransferase
MPTPPAAPDDPRRRTRQVVGVLFVCAFAVYALTMSRNLWTTDVYGANWTSWHIVTTGSPWIDGSRIPDLGHRSTHLLAIVQTSQGHTAFGRFPGVVAATLPAYAVLGSGGMSIVPGSLTAALLTAVALVLMFLALRRSLTERQAVVATVLFGFTTPVWTVSANLMWPHTLTVLGIAGMAWAATTGRWWWAGIFGGIALWGRVHAAIIVAVLGLLVGLRRRDPRIVLRTGVASGAFLLASCVWIHWVYGTWNPLGAYDSGTVGANAGAYRYSVSNQLGMFVAPDRGLLVWTPLVLVLLPALVRSWRTLPDWSRSLLIGGLVYTVVGGAMNTFTGGDGFYGYRYGLELLACATPALALSHGRMRRVERVLFGPVAALQAYAFLLGALYRNLYLPQTDAWHRNAFVHAVDRLGPGGWVVTVLVALAGHLVARRSSARPVPSPAESRGQRVTAGR